MKNVVLAVTEYMKAFSGRRKRYFLNLRGIALVLIRLMSVVRRLMQLDFVLQRGLGNIVVNAAVFADALVEQRNSGHRCQVVSFEYFWGFSTCFLAYVENWRLWLACRLW
jgi:hypothetical protein